MRNEIDKIVININTLALARAITTTEVRILELACFDNMQIDSCVTQLLCFSTGTLKNAKICIKI